MKYKVSSRGIQMKVKTRVQTHLYQLSCVNTANPPVNCKPKKPNAWVDVISPLASGLSFVLASYNKLLYDLKCKEK